MWAFTAVAPMLRFNAFYIFKTPVFFFASDFSCRTSDDVQARRVAVFFLVGIPSSLNVGTRFQHATLSWQRVARAALNTKISMTESEHAALVREQYDGGLANGRDTNNL